MFGEILGLATKFAPQIFSAASTLFGSSKTDDRQEDAQNFSAQQYATRYQTTVNDLKAAGLSPMLAYGQGPGTAPTSSAASAPAPSDLGQVHLAAKMNSAQVANIEADTANKAAQAKLIEAQAAQSWASAGQSSANVQKMDSEIAEIKARTANLPDEGRRIRQTIQMLADQGALMAQQGHTQVVTRDHLMTMIKKLQSETDLLNFDIDAAKGLGNFGRESGQFKTVVDLLRVLKGR